MDKIDKKAFQNMEYATADKTAIDFSGKKSRVTKKDIHNMLTVAGMTPAIGNIADAADALLYAAEGEFGSAALSMGSMMPFIGQTIVAKKALKLAKESGEKMVTLYRGVEKWYPGKMVKDRKFVGSGKMSTRMTRKGPEEWFYTTSDLGEEKTYAGGKGFWSDAKMTKWVEKEPTGVILEFEVPKSYIEKTGMDAYGSPLKFAKAPNQAVIFKEGLPKAFLTKVHK